MRILVSNPDSIGDVVLRQPMYAALSDAGHELLLAIRSFVAPIASLVAPKARTILLESDPYTPDFNPASDDVRRAVEAAREFAPEVYCIAPYQRTEFDELLAESLKGCRTVGMTGALFPGVIDSGLNRQSRIRLDREVPVSIDSHELEKSERLCSELLGRNSPIPASAREGRVSSVPAPLSAAWESSPASSGSLVSGPIAIPQSGTGHSKTGPKCCPRRWPGTAKNF